jgi:glycosyltransferase involved in cell wall biosynthesis
MKSSQIPLGKLNEHELQSQHKRRCVVITRFARSQPGYLDFAYRIVALSKRYEVTLISDHQLAVPEMAINGVRQHVLPGGESQLGWFRYLWNAARFIRHQRPDCVILLHTLAAPLTHLLGNVPTALYWNEHAIRLKSTTPTHFLKRIYQDWRHRFFFIDAARRADLLMPIGEAHQEDLLAQGCKPARTRLIYMGVDECFRGVAFRRVRQDLSEPLELIYTGTVQKARGRDVMLEAMAQAIKAGVSVRLTMVGASPEELAYCNDYARQLGVADAVTMHGRVPGHEIPAYIAQADAGICIWEDKPWWRFNPPTKLFEYLVAGLPVLASNICTHTQYIEHGRNGLIFEYDSSSLAHAIRGLWERRAELPSFKQRAFESSTPYMWENIEPVFLQSIEELVCK